MGTERFLSDHAGVDIGLLYVSKHSEADRRNRKRLYNYSYLAIPASLKIYFRTWQERSVFLKGGLQVSYNLSRAYQQTQNSLGKETLDLTPPRNQNVRGNYLVLSSIVGMGKPFAIGESLDLTPELLWINGLTSGVKNTTATEDVYALMLSVDMAF